MAHEYDHMLVYAKLLVDEDTNPTPAFSILYLSLAHLFYQRASGALYGSLCLPDPTFIFTRTLHGS